MLAGLACVARPPPPPRAAGTADAAIAGGGITPHFEYNAHSGYLPSGSDLMNGTMTIGAAERLCDTLSNCLGFTFGHTGVGIDDEVLRATKTLVYLKVSDEWVPHGDHRTHLKDRPSCKVQYLRYQKAGHGPYCCKGATCPAEGTNAHVLTESRCQLPAASPHGVPRCGSLSGAALSNVAPAATATASGVYTSGTAILAHNTH